MEAGLLEGLAPDEAFRILEELVGSCGLDPEKAEFARERYCAFYDELQRVNVAQKEHILEEKQLMRQLEIETKLNAKKLERFENEEHEIVEILEKDLKEAHVEALVAVQKEETLNEQIRELTEEKNQVEFRVQSETEARRQELIPVVEQLRSDVTELENNLSSDREKGQKSESAIANIQSSIHGCKSQIEDLKKVREEEVVQLNRSKSEPAKRKRQCDAIESVLRGIRARNTEQGNLLADKDTELNQLVARQKEAELEKAQAASALEQGRLAIEARHGDLQDIQRDMDSTLTEHRLHLADRVQIDLVFNEKETTTKQALESRARAIKAKEESLRQVEDAKKLLATSKASTAQIPPLETILKKLKLEKQELQEKMMKMKDAHLALKNEEDLFMSEFLKIEANEGSVDALLVDTLKHNQILDSEIESLKSVEAVNTKMLQSITTQRDHFLRTLSAITKQHRESEEELILKERALKDLEGLYEEKEKQRADFQALYDLMKDERNRFVHHIQISRQGFQEIQSKLKLLEQELEFQQEKHDEKCKQMEAARTEHQSAVDERDALKAELSQLNLDWMEKTVMAEKESAKVENCMFVINKCEKEMATVRESFENVLQNRNFTGLLLIDRNDELCVLYEKSNLHQQIQKQGDLDLRKRDDELRLLKIEVTDVERSIAATKKAKDEIPGVPYSSEMFRFITRSGADIDQEIAWLKCQLLEAKKRIDAQSTELEDPENPNRWRRLEGEDPEPEQLEAKIRQLEQSLDAKHVQCSQRALALEEIEQLNEKMKGQLRDQSESGIQLGKNLVKYELKNENAKLRLKAAAAELSIHKGMMLDLEQEKDFLKALVEDAKMRFTAGMAPTEEIDKQWDQILRHEETIQKLANEKAEIERLMSNGHAQTHCEPRPNAYIPEDLGIPRPFGAGAFKPTPAGATMRHTKKPKLPDVVI